MSKRNERYSSHLMSLYKKEVELQEWSWSAFIIGDHEIESRHSGALIYAEAKTEVFRNRCLTFSLAIKV